MLADDAPWRRRASRHIEVLRRREDARTGMNHLADVPLDIEDADEFENEHDERERQLEAHRVR